MNKIFWLSVLLIGLQSCNDFLDIVPDNVPSIDNVFENRSGAERFLATTYGYLPLYNSYTQNPVFFAGDESWVNEAAYTDGSVRGNFVMADIARGQQNAGNPRGDIWQNTYTGIRDCNVFLENINTPIDITDEERKQWIAEVKVLKAYYHYLLMRQYGPVPIVRDNFSVDVDPAEVRLERASIDDITAYIVELIDEAIPDLLAFASSSGSDFGRITKSTAAGIKAKTLVLAASPLFNGNTDLSGIATRNGDALVNQTFDPAKWDAAVKACKEAIDFSEEFGSKLFEFSAALISSSDDSDGPSDTTLVQLSVRESIKASINSSEIVWAASGRNFSGQQNFANARVAPPQGQTNGAGTFALNRSNPSYLSPTVRVAEMFYSSNGVPIEEDLNFEYTDRFSTTEVDEDHSYNLLPGVVTAKLNLNRENRFYASLGFDGGRWFGNGVLDDERALVVRAKAGESAGVQSATVGYSATGYFAKKLVHYRTVFNDRSASLQTNSYPWPVIRLADLYLLYAEALNESKAQPDAEVYEWIDKVRSRAGLAGVVDSWALHSSNPSKPTTKEGMRSIIHRERMIELVFEGHRFWDIRRWKRGIELLNSPIRGWNVRGTTTGDYYNIQTLFQQTFTTKDYLWPISLNTSLNNNSLVQNPGW